MISASDTWRNSACYNNRSCEPSSHQTIPLSLSSLLAGPPKWLDDRYTVANERERESAPTTPEARSLISVINSHDIFHDTVQISLPALRNWRVVGQWRTGGTLYFSVMDRRENWTSVVLYIYIYMCARVCVWRSVFVSNEFVCGTSDVIYKKWILTIAVSNSIKKKNEEQTCDFGSRDWLIRALLK